MKKYYIKATQQIGYGCYKTIVLETCEDMERAFERASELRAETGLSCFVDFEH